MLVPCHFNNRSWSYGMQQRNLLHGIMISIDVYNASLALQPWTLRICGRIAKQTASDAMLAHHDQAHTPAGMSQARSTCLPTNRRLMNKLEADISHRYSPQASVCCSSLQNCQWHMPQHTHRTKSNELGTLERLAVKVRVQVTDSGGCWICVLYSAKAPAHDLQTRHN
jgi:hypothetical protein